MGIFSKIWDFFVSPIVLKKEKPNELVIPVRLKSSRIKLNKRIEVPDNWWAVITVKDKICDILQSGTYKANENDLPITTRTGNALRKNKQGKIIPWIKCSVYYIRKNEIANHLFRAGLPFIVKTEHLGRIKGKVEGSFSVSVTNPELFLKCLFIEYYKISRNTGLNFVRNLVVEEMNALLESREDDFEKLIIDTQMMTGMMNHVIPRHLQNIGVNVNSIEVQSFVLSKKTQKVISEYLAAERPRLSGYNQVITSKGDFVNAINEEKMQSLITEAQEEDETIVSKDVTQAGNQDLEEILNKSVRPQLVDNTKDDAFLFERKDENKINQTEQHDTAPQEFTARRRGTVDLDLSLPQFDENFSRRRENPDILNFPTRDRMVSNDQTFDFTQDRRRGEIGGRNHTEDCLLGGRRMENAVMDDTSKKDIFAGTTDKKQCKYCDKLIGIEYQFCPFCGFKQDK